SADFNTSYPRTRMRLLEMLEDHLSEGLRLFDLGRLIASPSDPDSDVAVTLQHIERATGAVSQPESFIFMVCDPLRRNRYVPPLDGSACCGYLWYRQSYFFSPP